MTWLPKSIYFLPRFGAFTLYLAYRAEDKAVRRFSLVFTLIVFLLTLGWPCRWNAPWGSGSTI